MNYMVFDQFCTPRDIIAHCNDSVWEKRLWETNGKFGWAKWEKVA
jgi:hypothetical protein